MNKQVIKLPGTNAIKNLTMVCQWYIFLTIRPLVKNWELLVPKQFCEGIRKKRLINSINVSLKPEINQSHFIDFF